MTWLSRTHVEVPCTVEIEQTPESLHAHVTLDAGRLGAECALAMAPDHAPPTAKFLDWFLRRTSLDMMAPDADDRLLAAMKKGGWPV